MPGSFGSAPAPKRGTRNLKTYTWSSSYIPNAASVRTETAISPINNSTAKGTLYGSPIVFGSTDEYYDANLVTWNEQFPGQFPFKDLTDDLYGIYYEGGGGNDGQRQKTMSFAGMADDWVQGAFSRKNSKDTASSVISYLKDSIAQRGPFTDLIPRTQNGFLFSYLDDWNPNYDEGDKLAGAHNFNQLTYYPSALGDSPPLREVYTKFYGLERNQFIDGWGTKDIKDEKGNTLKGGATIMQNNWANTSINRKQDNSNRVIVTGPISHHSITFGNGDIIFAASPVMTLALHRLKELASPAGSSEAFAEKHTDTVLYPSPVGKFKTNELLLGNGKNLVYFDSSFKLIQSGSGGSTFIPSFGSFNWSIDWIPGWFAGINETKRGIDPGWLNGDKKALITPIPWDSTVPIPGIGGTYNNSTMKWGMKNPYIYNAYNIYETFHNMRPLAERRKSWDRANLYTINSYNQKGAEYQTTYFNGKFPDSTNNDTRVETFNPVNRLGGVTLKATGGNNIFYGFDPELWKHLLPDTSKFTTTYNQRADNAKGFNRSADHEWNTVQMLGGRGNNTFFLGNPIDDITNNAIFYVGNHSYILSLTHDKYFAKPDQIWDQGALFDNTTDPVTKAPLVSNVFMAIKSDKETIKIITQKADPGGEEKSELSAWCAAGTAAMKIATNTDKIQQDWTKYGKEGKNTWISKSAPYARIIGTFVPAIDMALGAVSAISGLINLFNAKPVPPPKEEISATYMESALDPDYKSVLINDWHPGTKINLTLPSTNPDAWGSLNLSIESPTSSSSSGAIRDQGTYLKLRKAVMRPNAGGTTSTSTEDFALVVLDNFGKKDDNYEFGYYGYNFNKGGTQAFQELDSKNLALFGTLPNPAMMEGSKRNELNFPSDYIYRHDKFDMRQDTSNYMAFTQGADSKSGFYSKYYLGDSFDNNDVSPGPETWDAYSHLKKWTSNVSIEFDSRSLGYYWQTVVKPIKTADGKIDAEAMGDPTKQEIDFERSKLWIRNSATKDWESYSIGSLSYNTKAYRYSLLANTFYYTTKNGDGDKEIKTRTERDQLLQRLEKILPDLRRLDQSSITDERNQLLMLQQITYLKDNTAVSAETTLTVKGKKQTGYNIKFGSESAAGKKMIVELFLYKNGDTPTAYFVKATEVVAATGRSPLHSTAPKTRFKTSNLPANRAFVAKPKLTGVTAKLQKLDNRLQTSQSLIPAQSSPSAHNPILASSASPIQRHDAVPWLTPSNTLAL